MNITATAESTIARPPRDVAKYAEVIPARLIARVLRVSLTAKLIGANIVIVFAAIAAALYAQSVGASDASYTSILASALVIGTAINLLLTYTALRPIRDIEGTIMRMWRGDTESRVASSAVADPELARVGQTLNSLLDRLERDRLEMRALAGDVVRAEDRSHRKIAVHLHESIAQSLASVTYMLTALAAKSGEPETAERIMEIRVLVGEVLDEVDVLSHDVHPRVLNDLGLVAGLRALAFDVSRHELPVSVRVVGGHEEDLKHLGPETSSALYRIAQEGVQNALRHSAGNHVDVAVGIEGTALVLRVSDNGNGFRVDEAELRRPGKGLFMMRHRAQLINANLRVDSSPGAGTRIQVTMPGGATSITS